MCPFSVLGEGAVGSPQIRDNQNRKGSKSG